MKRQFLRQGIVFLCLVMLLSLFACGEKAEASGSCTVVIVGNETVTYTVNFDDLEEKDNGLVSVLLYLQDTKGLNVKTEGTMLNEVGEIKNDYEANSYVMIWTSVEKDADVSVYATTVEYGGQTLTSSGVGAFDMTLEDGAVYYIAAGSF